MARTAVSAWAVVLVVVAAGCTQDFGTFDPAGSGAASATAGSPTPSSSTSSSGEGGNGAGTGSGGSPAAGGGLPTTCETAADCDDDNPCTDDGCVELECVRTPAPDVVLVDDPDDCRTIECVSGELVDQANDEEDPGDANPPCELTVCVGGVPTADLADDTVSCGPDPQFCDGDGLCAGCDPSPPDNDECGEATACAVPDCVDPGVCDPGFLPATADVDDPTDGDCRKPACTGSSAAPTSANDDTDVPDDLPCGDRGCANGTPSTTTVAAGDPCLDGDGVCDGAGTSAASCKTCIDSEAGDAEDAGCDSSVPVCDPAGSGTCVVCYLDGQTPVGCGDGETCDPAADGGDGACVECVTAADCDGADVCDPDTNTCETCASNGDDGSDLGCTNVMNPRCDESDRTCKGCAGDGDCADNERGVDCRSDSQCGCQNGNDCDHAEAAGTSCTGNVCQ